MDTRRLSVPRFARKCALKKSLSENFMNFILGLCRPMIYINWYKWTLMALYFLVNSIGNDGEVAPSASSEHVLEEVSNLNCFEIHVRARNF